MDSPFEIKTDTTGFGSPARSYAKKRLSPNELLIKDPYTTFFFQWNGEENFGLKFGDYLVIDRGQIPDLEDLVVFNSGDKLSVDYFRNVDPQKLWGVVTWTLSKKKK